jgi:hypothetical protein
MKMDNKYSKMERRRRRRGRRRRRRRRRRSLFSQLSEAETLKMKTLGFWLMFCNSSPELYKSFVSKPPLYTSRSWVRD